MGGLVGEWGRGGWTSASCRVEHDTVLAVPAPAVLCKRDLVSVPHAGRGNAGGRTTTATSAACYCDRSSEMPAASTVARALDDGRMEWG